MKYLFKPTQLAQQRQHEKKVWIYPVQLAMYATYLRDQGHEIDWDPIMTKMDPYTFEPIGYDQIIHADDQIETHFMYLPFPDRVLTNAKDPKWQNNGNFKFRPGTYTLASSGCWYGKCRFCVEANKDCAIVTRSPEDMVRDLITCKAQGFGEVFDDSGTFPDGEWLKKFCDLKIKTNLKDLPFSCNMRIDGKCDFKMMKDAGFRMLLYGIESANQYTLNKLNKGIKSEQIEPILKRAAEAGLEPHITAMLGYEWESPEEELETLKLVHRLLRKGYAKTAQASIYAPGGVKSGSMEGKPQPKDIYKAAYSAGFWINKIKDLKQIEDFIYLLRSIKEGLK